MCDQVFLAADHPLLLIPFDQEAAGLHVSRAGTYEGDSIAAARVRRWLTKPHVYHAGSHLGCGCGFAFSIYDQRRLEQLAIEVSPYYASLPDRLVASDEFSRDCQRSANQLADYLESVVHTGDVELLVCWLDEEDDPPKPRRTVTSDYFRGSPDRFGTSLRLDKGDFFLVRAGKASEGRQLRQS